MTHRNAISTSLLISVLALIAAPSAAHAGDELFSASVEGGLMRLKATETVYIGGFKLSELDWDSKNVPVLRGSFAINVTPEWQIKAEGRMGLKGGNSNMVDYDWIPPYYIDTSKSGWSDQSVHDDTSLDHFRSAGIRVTRRFLNDHTQSLSGGFGARYTDVQWTARGGSYVYSNNGRRNTTGIIPAGLKGVTYRQQMPTVYAHVDGSQKFGRMTLDAGLEGGLMVGGKATDDHWLRDLRVTDTFNIAPTFAANLGLSYNFTPTAAVYLTGSYEYTNLGRGTAVYKNTTTGAQTAYGNTAGSAYQAIYVGGGLKGKF